MRAWLLTGGGGGLQAAAELLAFGALPDQADRHGNTPLHFCSSNGHAECARLLLKHGARVDVRNMRGDTPLHNAARWGYGAVVDVLLAAGADPAQRNGKHRTPLEVGYGLRRRCLLSALRFPSRFTGWLIGGRADDFVSRGQDADDPAVADRLRQAQAAAQAAPPAAPAAPAARGRSASGLSGRESPLGGGGGGGEARKLGADVVITGAPGPDTSFLNGRYTRIGELPENWCAPARCYCCSSFSPPRCARTDRPTDPSTHALTVLWWR